MIHIDSDHNIKMTRGDTFAKTLTLYKNGEQYIPNASDEILFTLSKTYKGKSGYEVLVQKTIDPVTLLWLIESSDTAELPYGRYVYDLQITYGSTGYVETFADDKTLTLTEEVG